jgi:hypothetical protein
MDRLIVLQMLHVHGLDESFSGTDCKTPGRLFFSVNMSMEINDHFEPPFDLLGYSDAFNLPHLGRSTVSVEANKERTLTYLYPAI